MKTVGIKDLKNNLSAYLREVRRGEHILVTDRNEVVAELHEPGASYRVPGAAESRRSEWIERGELRTPRRPRKPCPKDRLVQLPGGTARRAIDVDRGDAR